MTTPPRPTTSLPPPQEESPDLFDYPLLRDYFLFLLTGPLRHKLLALLSFFWVVGLALAAVKVLPKTFHVETRILALRNQVISTLSNPGRSMPWDYDAPTQAARETVLRRDNLESLVRQTDLLNSWRQSRAPIVRLRDWLLRLVWSKEPTTAEITDVLVDTLSSRLSVRVSEGTVTIAIDWPDATAAFRLIQSAQQNFLEARHASEISTIAEAISILEGRAAQVQKEINAAMEPIEREQRAASRGRKVPAPARPPAPRPERRQEDLEVARLRTLLGAKRRAIADLEDFRQRRLTDLQAQLLQQRAIYADQHPMIVNFQLNIAALSRPSPQIEELQADERELARDIVRRGGQEQETTLDQLQPLVTRDAVVDARAPRTQREDPSIEHARGQLRLLFSKYSTLLDRTESARVEMETARAAFKYRYSVISPPQFPKGPDRPNKQMIMVAGLIGGLVLAFLACTGLDLRRALVIERWQLERRLELPVLAEIRRQ